MKSIEKKIFRDYSLKNLTTIRVGGKAKLFGIPSSVEETIDMLEYAYKIGIEPFILGGGSNCIFGDDKINRLIISTKNFKEIEIKENRVIAGAGVISSEILNKCEEKGLSGLEFTAGVPASVGGMVYMNYGSMGKEIFQYLTNIIVIQGKEVKMIKKDEINYSYRKGYREGIVILAEFELGEKNKEEIKKIKKEILSIKKQKQPMGKKTAGCIFKNPPGNFAGKLIEESGLKGFHIGDAVVSKKHANFIENTGNAKFQDIKALIGHIKEKVYEKFNIKLEEEVIIIEK
jgi:UDP-N-acetylmuramate dehydrogenase